MSGGGAPNGSEGARRGLVPLVVSGALGALLLVAGFLVATRTGAAWTLRALAPSGVTVERVEGRLLGPLVLEEVRIRAEFGEAGASEVRIDWQPGRLLRGELRLTRVGTRQVDVRPVPARPDAERGGLEAPSLSLPLAVSVEELNVEGLTVRSVEGGEVVRVPRAMLRAEIEERILRVDTLDLAAVRPGGGRLELGANGSFDGRAPHPLSLSFGWAGELPGDRAVEGGGELEGDLARLRVRHQTSRPASLRLEALIRNVLDGPEWDARIALSPTEIREVASGGPAGTVAAVVSGHGSADSATARFDGSVEPAGMERVDLTGRVATDGRRLRVDSVRAALARSGGRARARGFVERTDGELTGRIEAEWNDLEWPLGGEEESVRSPSGTVALEGSRSGFEARLEALAGAPSVPASRLRLDARGSGTDGLRLDGVLSAAVEEGERIDAAFEVEAGSEAYELRNLHASVAGTDASVELSGRLEPTDEPRFELQGRWSELRYPLRADSAWSSPRGRFQLRGRPTAFTAAVEGGLSRPGAPVVGWVVDVEGSTRGDTLRASARYSGSAEGWPAVEGRARLARTPAEIRIDTVMLRVPETGGRLDASASVPGVGRSVAGARARIAWESVGWPLSASPTVRSERGTASLERTDSVLRLRMRADVSGERLPSAAVALGASGSLRGVELDSLRIETLGGRITGDGRVTRNPDLAWTLELTGRGLDPGAFSEEWPGSLDLDLESGGSVRSDGTRATVTVSRLEGTLRDRAFRAGLDARLAPDGVDVDTLRVASGASRLDAAGLVGPRWDVGWRIRAEDLADFHPAMEGELGSRGRVAGPVDSLRIEGSVTGEELSLGESFVGRLDALVDVDLGGGVRSTVRADVRDLATRALAADSVGVRGAGRPGDHRAELEAFWGPDRLTASVSGDATETGWRGVLDGLSLDSERAGRWTLDAPVPLRAGPDRASLEELCWAGPGGRACAEATWTRAGGTAWSVTGRGLPLAFVAPLLPPDVELEGAIALDSRGTARPDEAPSGEATLSVDPGLLRYRLGDGTRIERAFEEFRIEAEAEDETIEASAEIRLAGLASVDGFVRTTSTAPASGRSLSGGIGFRIDDGGLLGAVHGELAETGGRIDGEFAVEGTLDDPRLAGRVDVEDGRATVVPLGVRLLDLRLGLRPDGASNRWTYQGGARSGDGTLEVTGEILVSSDSLEWSLDSRVTGRRFEVYRTALGHVLVTPDLRIRASPERVDVSGEVAVPRARLTARRLEPSVSTSPDVIVTEGGRVPEEESGVRVPPMMSGRVTVVLGDDVGLDALGIRGDLEGTLLVSAEPGRVPTASGELRILRGSYTAYRQSLQIERGRLLYANSPVDNPSLDLRITRRARDVLAGMNVTGSARAPTVTLFSEPSLADQEILAYLITGRPLNGLSRGEGRVVESLARSVGISGGNLVLARLGTMFGLEHARIEVGSGGQGASVVLGKQLLPRLEVDYAVGLLGAPNVARLRYRLGRGWYLQSESGRETGADLLYLVDDER